MRSRSLRHPRCLDATLTLITVGPYVRSLSFVVAVFVLGDTFADVADEGLREQCLGFVDQIRSGKPQSVIMMVAKSRGVSETLLARITKAAGGGGGSSSAATAAALSSAIKKSGGGAGHERNQSEAEKKPKKEKKAKKQKEKEKEKPAAAKEEVLFGESSDDESPAPAAKKASAAAAAAPAAPAPTPLAAAAPAPAISQALVVADDGKKKKKKDKKESAAGSHSSAVSSSSAAAAAAASPATRDRLTSIDGILSSSKKVKTVKGGGAVDADTFAQKHLGAPPPQQAAAPQKQPDKLKAYDGGQAEVATARMYGVSMAQPEKKGCIIC